MDMRKIKIAKRDRRRKKIRATVSGTVAVPRLSVFRSNKYMYAELIDDTRGVTLATASSNGLAAKNKTEDAREVGKLVARKAADKKIKKIVFDRGGYGYAGRVRALAEGAREGGLSF